MIAVFAYDFPHPKSCFGLIELARLGHGCYVYAAPWVDMGKTYPAGWEPKDIARITGHWYTVGPHAEVDLSHCELGIILGARILPKHIATAIPILNCHPGILPDNRGLGAVKRAKEKGLPQGITWHIIDEKVDAGKILFTRRVDADRPVAEIQRHINRLQIQTMGEAIENARTRIG